MEVTRHTTATIFVVHGNKTALHDHKRHSKRLPPGGHVERDELPHEAGLREVREETGLTVELVGEKRGKRTDSVRPLPRPRAVQLVDIDMHGGSVGHQHVDHVYYALAPNKEIDPESDEVDATRWDWYSVADLQNGDFSADVVELGINAIETVPAEETLTESASVR